MRTKRVHHLLPVFEIQKIKIKKNLLINENSKIVTLELQTIHSSKHWSWYNLKIILELVFLCLCKSNLDKTLCFYTLLSWVVYVVQLSIHTKYFSVFKFSIDQMKILSCGAKYFKNLLDSNLQTMVLLFWLGRPLCYMQAAPCRKKHCCQCMHSLQ